jgi:hypothetical protein
LIAHLFECLGSFVTNASGSAAGDENNLLGMGHNGWVWKIKMNELENEKGMTNDKKK